MRVVTSNVLFGMSITDGRCDVSRMATELAALEPDVLGMQEVDAFQQRSGDTDETREVVSALERRYDSPVSWRFVPGIVGVPGAKWRPAADEDAWGSDCECPSTAPSYGVGLIVRWPVESWHIIRLAPFPFRAPVFIPGMNRWMLIDDEPRVCVAAVTRTPFGLMTVAATHLSFVPGWNVRQLRQVARGLSALPGPRVLIGDMNLPGTVPRRVTGWKSASETVQRTFPSPKPKLQLDHVLFDDVRSSNGAERLISRSCRAQQLGFSDHRALVAELSLPN